MRIRPAHARVIPIAALILAALAISPAARSQSPPAIVYASPQSPVPAVAPVAPATQPADPTDFTAWLNAHRLAAGLRPVAYAPRLAALCRASNAHQVARGFGHHTRGAGRQCVGMGTLAQVSGAWMASPAHRRVLMDPAISRVGIDGMGGYWTFDAE